VIQPEIEQLVAEIHATPQQAVLEFAGAGSLALFWLHSQSGSSRTVLEAVDRYAALSTIDLLGTQPRRFVTAKTARAMAIHAYQRGLRLSAADTPVVGIGCTATIATDYAKRGNHGCRVCVVERTRCSQYAITLQKEARARHEEEVLVSRLVLQGLARACGLEPTLALQLRETEALKTASEAYIDPLDSLLAGKVNTVTMRPDGDMATDQTLSGVAVLSGAFNPLHAGHIQLARAATARLRRHVVFELSVQNADKGTLSNAEIRRRLRQFRQPWQLVLTRQPLFAQKAASFGNSVFVVGYDTALRLLQSRYYDDDESKMHAALATIQAAGGRFLVAGRRWQGLFCTASDLSIPAGFTDLFKELPEGDFRLDTSSAEVREGKDHSNTHAHDAA
jgi:hypothetical protein